MKAPTVDAPCLDLPMPLYPLRSALYPLSALHPRYPRYARNVLHLASALACSMAVPAFAAPAAAPAPAPKIALSAFVLEDQFSHPRLAPDGKHIAITAQVPSGERFVPVVAFYSLPDLKQVGAIRMPAFEVPLDYIWVSNNRLVITKGKELGSREKPVATGEVLATNYDGSKQEYLFGYNMFKSSRRGDRYGDDYAYGQIEGLPRTLNDHFYLASHGGDANHSLLYDIDSGSAIRKLIADLPARNMDFIFQSSGTPRFAYGIGDDGYALRYNYNDADGSWKEVTGKTERRYVPLLFRPDDASFLVELSSKGGPDEVIEENLATGARKVLYADREASAGDLQPGSQRGMPLGLLTTIGVPRPHYFDPNSDDAKLHKTLSAAFPDSVVSFLNFSSDGSMLLFSVVSDRDPGAYYLFNRASGKADMLFASMTQIEPADMRPRTPISFKARDGVTLHGYLTMPAHAAGVKVPLVLVPHGGPHGPSDHWYFDTDAQFLASRGYAVLQVNFRGSGGRGVNFEHAGYRQWGANIQDDLTDGIGWAISQGDVDGTRVCAYGASFGGYSALMLAAREPQLIKCAVGYAGVYDLKLIINGDDARRNKATAALYRRYLGDDKAELERYSPVSLAAQIKAPVLLIHGGKDERAPLAHAEAMRAALIAQGRPPEWLLAPGEGHGFYDTANVTRFYQSLEAFLDKHIGH